ncbi:Dam family site-specific DNA-(adenine-N6)-methyltransferase [Nissabacter sp. SGAir0207]|uniref:Dam family site-specific DNA-(adenine-N6)-methyltransferase n=1 Tax=Nissabacter sp. SGAir0207 TaxID=2126321 RepID=UPI0010CD3F53|nr:Dam family site-specific DNA-(adenine-N6)-methyltransferase [Nissabacter sp. SGAir0207]QCR38745.1 DNA adenine methylase [Nissabacter sp. SGAir0207]
MIYGSVCSGIEAASVAWEPLGFRAAWFSEIDPFPSAVLAHHWPDVPNLGDMTTIAGRVQAGNVPAPDLLVGGTPCQAFSVAGLGTGLEDERGQLTLKYVELANEIDHQRAAAGKPPAVIVWENVPGVLSDGSNAFGCFLAGLAGEAQPLTPGEQPEPGKSTAYWRWSKPAGDHIPKWPLSGCVYGQQRRIAWRTLDAQYFGVAQRRRRVFVVASAREDLDPAEVLFEFDSLRLDSPPSRVPGATVATGAEGSAIEWDNAPSYSIAGNVINRTGRNGGNQLGIDKPEVSHTLTRTDVHAVMPVRAVSMRGREGGTTAELGEEVANCLSTGSGGSNKAHALISQHVRRLRPVECERLQGFPDGHSMIPFKGKPAESCPDAPRYKAVGNSMAVPVMHWIGQRILENVSNAVMQPAAPSIEGAVRVRPFLKWAGGKYSVLDALLPALGTGQRLVEPFVGAGSVFMNAGFERCLLADINPDLINLYQHLSDYPGAIIPAASKLVADCDSNEAYLALREEFNARLANPARHAALFLALNRTCFNGLSRYNRKGMFNVGWNKKAGSYFPAAELDHFVGSSARREFICAPFQETIAQAGAGDVIFCDPPYEPMPGEGNFTSYTEHGFTYEDQVTLVDHLLAAHGRGARVVITNSSAPKVMSLYLARGFTLRGLVARRAISCASDTRGSVHDIIAIL